MAFEDRDGGTRCRWQSPARLTTGSTGTVVYDHWLLGELRDVVATVQYPALSLPVVSPHVKPS